MTNKIKSKEIEERAKKLLRDARAAEWAIIKAEEYQEKFELSNATIGVFVAVVDEIKAGVSDMTLTQRLFNTKEFQDKHLDLSKTYFKQLNEIDSKYRKREEEYKAKLMEEAKGMDVSDDDFFDDVDNQ